MFHSQSSLSEFLRFKSYLANLELSPVESYQSFDFVNFMLDERPCFLQMDIKTPLWAFCILPASSSISGKCGPHIYGGGRESKNKNVQSSVFRLQCDLVVSQQMATSGQQPHNNPAGLGSHVPDQIPWSSQPEQNQENYCYFH
jgi:hypothetical protein